MLEAVDVLTRGVEQPSDVDRLLLESGLGDGVGQPTLLESSQLPESETDEDDDQDENDDVSHDPAWGEQPPHRLCG
jgi:hypothetical protein